MIIFITQNIEIFILNYMSRVYSSKHIAHIIHNVKLRANLLYAMSPDAILKSNSVEVLITS